MTVNPVDNYFKISSIADMVCDDLSLSPAHYGRKFMRWGLWGYSQYKMDMSQDVKTDLLPVSDALTVTLPTGCIDWVKIGIPYGQYVITLCVNDKMSKADRTLLWPR